jgi:pimeloyl-ACP methyl ester carboxylesterase
MAWPSATPAGRHYQALALEHPELLRSLIIANSLHSPEMWQANHANINAELARQHPEVWDRITALRAQGLRSTGAARVARRFAILTDGRHGASMRAASHVTHHFRSDPITTRPRGVTHSRRGVTPSTGQAGAGAGPGRGTP